MQAGVYKAIFSPDGNSILACLASETPRIVMIDTISGETLLNFNQSMQECWALAFSPDGQQAVSGHSDGSIFLWDSTQGSLVRTFTNQGFINELLFTPDGQTVISGSNNRAVNLTLWDVATGQPYRRFAGHLRPVDGLAISADGRVLLTAAYDGTARLWRIDSQAELLDWTRTNRYIPELTCDQRALYRLEPLCADTTTP